MDKKEFIESMKCRGEMDYNTRIGYLVHILSEFMNNEDVTYDEFNEVFGIIDHYTMHEAELVQHNNELKYKKDHDIPLCEDLDYDEIDEDDLYLIEVDLQDEDGVWFEIPVIG